MHFYPTFPRWIILEEAIFDRLQWQLAELRASLDRCAVALTVMAAELLN